MRKVLIGLCIVLCAFGVVIGVVLKTNPAVQAHYARYAKLLTQRFNQSCSASWVDRSSMTGWDQVLRSVDVNNLSDEMADALVYGFFPTCESPSDRQDAIKIADHVKNCTQKKKKWTFPDGLGGACFPWFKYDKNLKKLLKMDACEFYPLSLITWAIAGEESPYLCKTIENGRMEWGIVTSSLDSDLLYSWGLFAVEKALSLGLLASVAYDYDNGQLISLPNDQDTEIMYASRAWSDHSGNYFAAGKRSFSDKILYVINDKLYDPEMQGNKTLERDDFGSGKKVNSDWLFGGFKGKTPLVKRFLNLKKSNTNLTWDQSLDIDYVLETCELDR